jgi:hypothetical protein
MILAFRLVSVHTATVASTAQPVTSKSVYNTIFVLDSEGAKNK